MFIDYLGRNTRRRGPSSARVARRRTAGIVLFLLSIVGVASVSASTPGNSVAVTGASTSNPVKITVKDGCNESGNVTVNFSVTVYGSSGSYYCNGTATGSSHPTGSCTISSTLPAGNYSADETSTGSSCGDWGGNYSFTVGLTSPVIASWPTASAITYGQPLSASILTGGSANVSGTFAWTGNASEVVYFPGTYEESVTFTPTSPSYSTVAQDVSVTINKAVLTVTANNFKRTYGTANPALSDTITGYVNGDTSSVVSGAASCTTTATTSSAPGTYPITCSTGTLSASNYTFSFVSGTLTVAPITPTISISNIPSAATYGGGFTPTYSYSGTGSPTESVASSTTAVCTVSGTTVSFIGIGTCTLTASATATTDYTAATGSAQSFTVSKATPSIALSSSVNPLPYEALSVFTATVSGGHSPTGNVAFEINGATFGTVALSSGKAVYSGTNEVWAPGTYTISAVYAGDAYNNSVTATLSQTVNKPTVTTVVGGTTVVEGTSITFQGNGFGSTQGSSTVTISGMAATVTSWSSTSITVIVPVGSSSGNGNLIVTVNGNASAPLPLVLKIAVKITITSVTPSTTTINYGQPVTVNVEANTSTSAVPTGSATCTATGTPTVSSTQTVVTGASYSTASLVLDDIPVGTQTITCTFAGTGKYNNSTGTAPTATVTIIQGLQTPTAKVVSSSSTSAYGDYVTFTATITGVSGSPAPSGMVTFLDGGGTLNAVQLTVGTSTATGTYSTAALSVTSHQIKVEYSGDSYYSSAVSAVITQVVTNQSGACIP